MIKENLFSQAYVEVLEILKYISIEDYKKIPQEILNNMEKEKDKNYKYEIIYFDNLERQEMLKETEAILAVFFRDYWATEEQCKKIKQHERREVWLLEEEKRRKYNPDNLFESTNKTVANSDILSLSVPKKEYFFEKLINKIKTILLKNKF